MSEPEISVVVASHARPRRLGLLLEALAAQDLGHERFEVVIALAGPDAESERVLDEWTDHEELRLKPLTRVNTRGAAGRRNVGWRTADAPVIAFTDDDCEPAPGWLSAILEAYSARPGAIVQGPTLPNPREAKHDGPFSHTQHIVEPGPWFQTCNVAYPRQLLDELGGFDERFGDAGEDTDLGWRAVRAGAPRRFSKEATVLHAVEPVGPRRLLGRARRGTDSALALKLHPELRREATYAGIFWNRAHARLALALLGLLLASRRGPLLLLLTLPYLKGLRGRASARGGSPALLPFLVAWDLVEVSKTLQGAARHRIFTV